VISAIVRVIVTPAIFVLLGLYTTACIVSSDYTEPKPSSAIAILLQVLHDPDPAQRRTAAQALGKIGDKIAVPALIDASRDPEAAVRQQGAWALGMIGDDSEAVRSTLINLLFDSNAQVRETAAWALGQTGDATTGLHILQQRLRQPGVPDDTKRLALVALGDMEISSSLGLVRTFLRDPNPYVRRAAGAALAEIGGADAAVPLSQLLSRDLDAGVRLEAAFRLGKISDRAVEKALTAALKDSDENVRRMAEAALKEIAKPRAS